MRLEPLERASERASPLERLDARIKLIAALAIVIVTVAAPIGAWSWYGALGFLLAFLIGLSGVPPRVILLRWLTFLVLIGFLALVIAPTHPARARAGLGVVAASIVIKNSLAIAAMLLLSGVTSFHSLLVALRKLRMPLVLIATLGFMERYRFVLTDELARMAIARRARSFRKRSTISLGLAGGLIGLLFLRAFERAERVHGAMVARGWQGTFHSLED
jgi:cobalt/nickel transport system permease protein